MTFTQLLKILWVRRWLLVFTTLTLAAVVLAINLTMAKTYIAESSVVVTSRNTDPITGAQVIPQTVTNYIATQINVIESRNVALKVVSDLHLAEQPTLQRRFQQATHGDAKIETWLADWLLTKLDVKPTRDSNIVTIDFSATDPKFAADVANAFADAYIRTSLELTLDPAKRQTVWFEEQVQSLRKVLEDAQQRLASSQRSKQIVGTDERLDIEQARLNEISTQLIAAQSRMYDAQTRQRAMASAVEKGRAQELPDIMGNSLLQSLKSDLARAQSKLADISQRYDRNNPLYMSAAAEVKAIEDKIVAEMETTKGSITQTSQISQQQVNELTAAFEKQKAKILSMKQNHDEIDVLNRDVENAQKAYDTSLQRAGQLRLESRLDQTNIAVLDAAVPPAWPAKPRVLLNTALALVLGAMLGAALALGAEMLDRRVRSAADLVTASGLPVLAEIPRVSAAMQRKVVKANRREPKMRAA